MASSGQTLEPTGKTFTRIIHNDVYPDIQASTKANLSSRSVLITGTATPGGVGRATALAFAEAGASTIVLADVLDFGNLEDEIYAAARAARKPVPKILVFQMDVTNVNSVANTAREIEAEVGGLDILINNAGYLAPYDTLTEADPDTFWRPWDVNLKGTFNVTRAYLPLMLNKSGGLKTVVNLSSIGALIAVPGGGSYRTSKLAVLRWTEVLQLDYEDQGLLAYCIHPGAIMSKLAENLPVSLQRTLQDKPELAANTLAWLTQERRPWLGGRYVSCTWDMPELMSRREEIFKGDKLKMRMVF